MDFKYGDLVIDKENLSVNKVITIKQGIATLSNRTDKPIRELLHYTPEVHKELITKNFDIGKKRYLSIVVELDDFYDLSKLDVLNKSSIVIKDEVNDTEENILNQVLSAKEIPNREFLTDNDNVFIDCEGVGWLTLSTAREVKSMFSNFPLFKISLLSGKTERVKDIDDAFDALNEGGMVVAYRVGSIY